jgi:hypothetical protein
MASPSMRPQAHEGQDFDMLRAEVATIQSSTRRHEPPEAREEFYEPVACRSAYNQYNRNSTKTVNITAVTWVHESPFRTLSRQSRRNAQKAL